jgi:hypothetical protein
MASAPTVRAEQLDVAEASVEWLGGEWLDEAAGTDRTDVESK